MEESLLQLVSQGQPQAVQKVIDRYGGLVYSLARRFLRNAADAEDAVQDIFVEIWKSASRYDPALSSEQTFIAMVARRRLIDRQRSAGRKPVVGALADEGANVPGGTDATAKVDVSDEAAKALAAVESLAEQQRIVLRMAICEGWSHQEIADKLNMPLGTVKTYVRRGLMAVRERLGTAPKLGVSS